MVAINTIIHGLQASLASLGMWAAVEVSVKIGFYVFATIALLELIELVAQWYQSKSKLEE